MTEAQVGENTTLKIEGAVLSLQSFLRTNFMTGRKTGTGRRVISEVSSGGTIDLGLFDPEFRGYELTYRITCPPMKFSSL